MVRIGKRRSLIAQCCAVFALLLIAQTARAIAPSPIAPGDVNFTINAGQNVKAISPWIYGMNGTSLNSSLTSDRLGGNRWTAYNWETNASNAGRDYKYENDNYLVQNSPTPNVPGAAITPTLNADAAAGRALIVTVPMAGYVSAEMSGPVPLADFAPSARFNQVVAKKPTALSLTPNTTDGVVYNDEFVHWVESHQESESKSVLRSRQ